MTKDKPHFRQPSLVIAGQEELDRQAEKATQARLDQPGSILEALKRRPAGRPPKDPQP